MSLLPHFLPDVVLLENVVGFADSKGEELLYDTFTKAGYGFARLSLCPSLFGLPSLRPRLFYIGTRRSDINIPDELTIKKPEFDPLLPSRLSDYLDREPIEGTFLPRSLQARYERSLAVIEDATDRDAQAICFTSGYARTMRAGGSFLRMEDGSLRRFSPNEIVRLLGFPESFKFPSHLDLKTQWRLAGNSVDLTCIRYLLSIL